MKLPNGEQKKEPEGSEFGAAYPLDRYEQTGRKVPPIHAKGAAYLIEKWWVSVLFYCKIAIFCYFCYYFVTDNSLIIK